MIVSACCGVEGGSHMASGSGGLWGWWQRYSPTAAFAVTPPGRQAKAVYAILTDAWEYPNHCPMKKLKSIMHHHTISK